MRIVCLAWGSLIWKPGFLQLASGWQEGGPVLPIEFARVGDDQELARALYDAAPALPVWWARLRDTDLARARESLREREGIPPERPEALGSLVRGDDPAGFGRHGGAIERWTDAIGEIDAVIWTALPPRFAGIEGKAPSPAEAVDYLRRLEGQARAHAEDYVRRVPEVFRTPTRHAIEAALGWVPP